MITTLLIIIIPVAIVGLCVTIIAIVKTPLSDIDEDGNKPIG
jgi:hypothetical protein